MNYKILFGIKILKSIIFKFIEMFLVLYFLTLSESNIIPLGIYNITLVTVLFLVMVLFRNYFNTKKRLTIMKLSFLFDLIYFLTIIILQERVIEYIYLLGALMGISEGLHCMSFSLFESNEIENVHRTKFQGTFTAIHSFTNIIFPLIFGSAMSIGDSNSGFIIIVILIIIAYILTIFFKDNGYIKKEKIDMKNYTDLIKNNKILKNIHVVKFFSGLTYSYGAFQSIIIIYILKIFNNNFTLGIYTSIFSLITCIIGIAFTKKIKKEQYKKFLFGTNILTIISLIIMVIYCNFLTIIIFNLFQTISKNIMDLINKNSEMNVSNLDIIKNKYKSEYFLYSEKCLFISRIISYSLFIIMAYTSIYAILPIFIVFLIFLIKNSIKTQKLINQQ